MPNFWDNIDKKPINNINVNNIQNAQPNFVDFMNFAKNFKGNPREKIMELLSNGQMSNQQFEQLKQQANQFASMFNMFRK